MLLLASQHLSDKLTYAEPAIVDSGIVQAQIDDNHVRAIAAIVVVVVVTVVVVVLA